MNYFLINKNMPESFVKTLSLHGTPIKVPENALLDFPVSTHPDMLAANIKNKLFIHSSDIRLGELLKESGASFTFSENKISSVYPMDIPLNLFTVGNLLFANERYMSRAVLSFARLLKLKIINVPQGYTKCSTMVVGNGIITADTSIYNAACAENIDALLIEAGHIGIEKYGTGFIGGASGEIAEDKVAVFGNLDYHPDSKKIRDFAYLHGTEIVQLGNGPLFDYGGIVRFTV